MFYLLNWQLFRKEFMSAVDMPHVYLNGSVEDAIGYDQIVVLGNQPLPEGVSDVTVLGYNHPCKAYVKYKSDNPIDAEGYILDAKEVTSFFWEHPNMCF